MDKLYIFIRTNQLGKAQALVPEVIVSVKKSQGWHGWLWKIRLLNARAELAVAGENKEEALRYAEEALEESRARQRVKYESLALQAKAGALILAGEKKKAIRCQLSAIKIAREMNYPCLLLKAITRQLDLEGTGELLKEAKAIVRKLNATLPGPQLTASFEKSEPVQAVMRHTKA